jgi:hypothetical protein
MNALEYINTGGSKHKKTHFHLQSCSLRTLKMINFTNRQSYRDLIIMFIITITLPENC